MFYINSKIRKKKPHCKKKFSLSSRKHSSVSVFQDSGGSLDSGQAVGIPDFSSSLSLDLEDGWGLLLSHICSMWICHFQVAM